MRECLILWKPWLAIPWQRTSILFDRENDRSLQVCSYGDAIPKAATPPAPPPLPPPPPPPPHSRQQELANITVEDKSWQASPPSITSISVIREYGFEAFYLSLWLMTRPRRQNAKSDPPRYLQKNEKLQPVTTLDIASSRT